MSIGSVSPSQILEVARNQLQPEQEKIDAVKDKVTAQEDRKLALEQVDRVLEELRSVLSNFTSPNDFIQRTVSSSDSDTVVASASSSAPETSFNFGSITQLAQAARVTSTSSLGLTSGASPYLVSDSDINGGTVNDYDPNLNITNSQGGTDITAGTFTINGTEIEIDNDDTLNTILTKINNSGSGVTAVFDDPNDLVRLSGTEAGSDQTITFSDGTSNFFAALNLTTAVDGTDNEWEEPLDDSPLSAVSTGYFTINNFTFYVDPTTESLDDVIRKINNSNAGVTAFYDDASNKVTLQNEEEGQDLLLANDTSGFLSAIKVMNTGDDLDGLSSYSRYEGTKAIFELNGESLERDSNTFTIQGVTFSLLGTSASNVSVTINQDVEKATTNAESFVAQFNATISLLESELDNKEGPLYRDQQVRTIKNKLLDDVLATVSNPGSYTTLVDLGFNLERQLGGTFTLQLDSDQFREKLQEDETSVQQLFAYDDDGDGLYTNGGYAISTRSYLDTYTRSVTGFFAELTDSIQERISDLNLNIDDMETALLSKEEKLFFDIARQVSTLQRLQLQQAQVAQSTAVLLNSLGF